jgi:hypothetical protein
MKRRSFIGLTALTAATISVPFLHCSETDKELDKILALPEILSQVQDKKTITTIGKAYGAVHKDEYSVKKLQRLLTQSNAAATISPSMPEKDIYAVISKNIQQDIETGNTIILNGWVLSLTEARQCALFSLVQKNQ